MIFGGVEVADWYLLTVLVVFGSGLFGVGWWYYFSRLKVRSVAVFSRVVNGEDVVIGNERRFVGGIRRVIGQKDFNVGQEDIVYRKKVIPIKEALKHPSIQKFNSTYYDIDFDSGDVLTYGGVYHNVDPKAASKYLNDGLILRMVRAAGGAALPLIFVLILVAVVGVAAFLGGVQAAPFVAPQHGLYRLLPNGTFVMT